MGANEIANRIEAAGWLAAAGQHDGEGGTDVVPGDFFFRSIVGFQNRLEVINPEVGDDWSGVESVSIALFLDRNYARKDTTIQVSAIESLRVAINTPPVTVAPISYQGVIRVLPLSADGYKSFKSGGVPPLSIPGSLDPYSVLVCIADLEEFQRSGFGVEFAIQVMRLPDLEGGDETGVSFVNIGGGG